MTMFCSFCNREYNKKYYKYKHIKTKKHNKNNPLSFLPKDIEDLILDYTTNFGKVCEECNELELDCECLVCENPFCNDCNRDGDCDCEEEIVGFCHTCGDKIVWEDSRLECNECGFLYCYDCETGCENCGEDVCKDCCIGCCNDDDDDD